ncbi:MAG TPA: HD domain-containing protein [Clostridia bacterium]
MNTFTDTLIGKAYRYAKKKHEGQKYGKKPFIYHPLEVAKIIKIICPTDINLIAAAYLHDTLEDTNTSMYDLMNEFNNDIASLVNEVTKTDYNTFPNLKTLRGVILKYADRTANLSNVHEWDIERQETYILKSKFWM